MSRELRPAPEGITQSVAAIATLGLLAALYEPHDHRREDPAVAARAVQLSLLPEPPTPEPPTPNPPHPEPRKPHQAAQQAARNPPPLASKAALVVATPMAQPDDELKLAAAPPPPPPATAPSRASVEDAYAEALRQNVDARTAVPDSPQYRLLRPSGATQVRFILDRVGTPSDVGIARSSGSGILDRQAVSIVSTGRYPPFPETAYAGQSRHVFIITIEFRS